MDELLKIVTLLNAATPGLITLIPIIRHTDGSISVLALLDEADAQFTENIRKAQEWLTTHPPKPKAA